MTNEDLEQLVATTQDTHVLQAAYQLLLHPLYNFVPRPDSQEDQQTAFLYDDFPGVLCILAGNGSGKSYLCAYKVVRFLMTTEPPEKMSPYWVLSNKIEQVARNCWQQNMSKFLPENQIDDITWYSKSGGLPKSVILKPNNGKRWVIEFTSYDTGRERLQGINLPGWWADEQANWGILNELSARCRKWSYGGAKLYSLTPLEPDTDLEAMYEDRLNIKTWKFYHLSTQAAVAAGHVLKEYIETLKETELDTLLDTRLYGHFACYEGAIYRKSFNPAIHVIEPIDLKEPHFTHIRGLDLGWSHATAAVFCAKSNGNYYVYREYLQDKASIEDHVEALNTGWQKNNPCFGDTYCDFAQAQERHELAIRGLPTTTANKEVKQGIARVQSLFRTNKLFIFKNCEKLIQELKGYRWHAKKLDEPLKVNDDLCDALRYCIFSDSISPIPGKLDRPMEKPKLDPYMKRGRQGIV